MALPRPLSPKRFDAIPRRFSGSIGKKRFTQAVGKFLGGKLGANPFQRKAGRTAAGELLSLVDPRVKGAKSRSYKTLTEKEALALGKKFEELRGKKGFEKVYRQEVERAYHERRLAEAEERTAAHAQQELRTQRRAETLNRLGKGPAPSHADAARARMNEAALFAAAEHETQQHTAALAQHTTAQPVQSAPHLVSMHGVGRGAAGRASSEKGKEEKSDTAPSAHKEVPASPAPPPSQVDDNLPL